jgi:preprotein translocase subunit SecG
MISGLLTALLVIVSILLVIAILLQSSKGGGLAGVAGGMASSTVFGGRAAANFLQKATTILATAFLALCLVLALLSEGTTQQTSVTQQAVQATEAPSPVPSIPGGQQVSPVQPSQGTATDQAPAGDQPATGDQPAGEQPAEGN